MEKPLHHLFICSSSRMAGEPKGGCQRKRSPDLVQYAQEEIDDRGLDSVMVTNTGCLKLCDDGPVMIAYPEGAWYGSVDESVIDAVLDGIEEGRSASVAPLM